MTKCDFNKVKKQLYWNHTSGSVFSCKFAGYFQNIFLEKHLWMAASDNEDENFPKNDNMISIKFNVFLK